MRILACALLALACVACGPAQPTPKPTTAPPPPVAAVPSPSASPSPVPATQLDEDPSDVAASFMTNVLDLAEQAAVFAESSCDELATLTPEVSGIRGFAATLKRVASQDPNLESPEVRAVMDELDAALGQLNGALSLCGISLPPS